MEELAGLLALERSLGEKRLVKRGQAYREQWWKTCRSYARTGALAEGAESSRERSLILALAALCGQEGIRTEKRKKPARPFSGKWPAIRNGPAWPWKNKIKKSQKNENNI